MTISDDRAEALVAEWRPPQEILDVDRISGPFVENEEILLGVGDTVYRSTLYPPIGWMLHASAVNAREERGENVELEMLQVVQQTFAYFKPAGLMQALQHPANARFVIGAWANLVGEASKQRATIVTIGQPVEYPGQEAVNEAECTTPPPSDDDLGRMEYERIQAKMGFMGRLMAPWDQLPERVRTSYIANAKRRNGDTK